MILHYKANFQATQQLDQPSGTPRNNRENIANEQRPHLSTTEIRSLRVGDFDPHHLVVHRVEVLALRK